MNSNRDVITLRISALCEIYPFSFIQYVFFGNLKQQYFSLNEYSKIFIQIAFSCLTLGTDLSAFFANPYVSSNQYHQIGNSQFALAHRKYVFIINFKWAVLISNTVSFYIISLRQQITQKIIVTYYFFRAHFQESLSIDRILKHLLVFPVSAGRSSLRCSVAGLQHHLCVISKPLGPMICAKTPRRLPRLRSY